MEKMQRIRVKKRSFRLILSIISACVASNLHSNQPAMQYLLEININFSLHSFSFTEKLTSFPRPYR